MDHSVHVPWGTTAEAAARLAARGVLVYHPRAQEWRPPTPKLVRKWCAEGRICAHRLGRDYLVYLPALETFQPPARGRPWQPTATPAARRRRGRRRRVPPPPPPNAP